MAEPTEFLRVALEAVRREVLCRPPSRSDHRFAGVMAYSVDEGLLSRPDGAYWRTGGRFEP